MQVILRSDVDGLGHRGDIVDVADGHARNFLLPKGHAFKASPGAIEQAAKMRSSRDAKDHESREAATAVASSLVPKTITIAAKASAEGKLFGSVHAAEVAEAVQEQTGIEVIVQVDQQLRRTLAHLQEFRTVILFIVLDTAALPAALLEGDGFRPYGECRRHGRPHFFEPTQGGFR